MFEAAVSDGAQEFVLQQEVAETSRVNADIAALLVGAATRHGQVTLLLRVAVGSGGSCSGCGSRTGSELLVGVVDEILFVRHGGDNR